MLGIIILTYNTWGETEKCIESLLQNPPTLDLYRVYIIDNGSVVKPTKKILDYLNEHDNFFMIRTEENKGFNGGLNIGAERVIKDGCSSVLFSSNDIYFRDRCIDLIVDFFRENSGIAFPKNYNLVEEVSNVGKKYFEHIWEVYTLTTPIIRFFPSLDYKLRGGFVDKNINDITQTKLNQGACFAMSREALSTLTPFDTNITLFFEEMILSCNADKKNIKIFYIPKAEVTHAHGKTTKQMSANSVLCMQESAIYYLRTYLHASRVWVFPLYIYFILQYKIKSLTHKDYKELLRTQRQRVSNMMHNV